MKITKTTRIDTGDGTLTSVFKALADAYNSGIPADAVVVDIDLGYEVQLDLKLRPNYTGSTVKVEWEVDE